MQQRVKDRFTIYTTRTTLSDAGFIMNFSKGKGKRSLRFPGFGQAITTWPTIYTERTLSPFLNIPAMILDKTSIFIARYVLTNPVNSVHLS